MQESKYVHVRETEKNIVNLSDELLVHICAYLSSKDILNLCSTCARFNVLLCERKLIRNLNLRAVYSMNTNVLKTFFQPTARCHNVDTISLASCYWLTSSDILSTVLRLTNLKHLHVQDTNLSIQHLTRVLKSVKTIEGVSWTFHMTSKISISDIQALNKQFHRMKFLNFWMKGYAVSFVPLLLCELSVLEELKFTSYKYRDVPAEGTKLLRSAKFDGFEFPSLQTLILNVPEELESGWFVFITQLCYACCQSSEWRCIWLDTKSVDTLVLGLRRVSAFCEDPLPSVDQVYALSNGITEDELLPVLKSILLRYFKFKNLRPDRIIDFQSHNSKITHLHWGSHVLPRTWPAKLEQLYIPCTQQRLKKLSVSPLSYDILLELTHLSVPFCMFIECLSDPCLCHLTSEVQAEEKQRTSRQCHLKKKIHTNCLLKVFTDIAPNIQELEIKCLEQCSLASIQNNMSSLVLIGCWSNLETLFLEKIPTADISFLQEVCSQCPKLRRLGLKNVGVSGYFPQTKELVECIDLLHNLEDFLFEHSVVNKLMDIINALSRCSKLKRVSILCKRTDTKQNIALYLNLLEQCKDMVFLFVRVASITHKNEKDFQRQFKARFLSERKYLWASVEGVNDDRFWESMPTVHCYEMVVDPALLGVMPPFQESIMIGKGLKHQLQ